MVRLVLVLCTVYAGVLATAINVLAHTAHAHGKRHHAKLLKWTRPGSNLAATFVVRATPNRLASSSATSLDQIFSSRGSDEGDDALAPRSDSMSESEFRSAHP